MIFLFYEMFQGRERQGVSMTIKWIKKKDGQVTNITQAVSSVCWSGSVSQAARTVELSVISAPDDKDIKKLKLLIAAGDIIKLFENGELIFYGEVQTKRKSSENGTIMYSCSDLLCHLLRSTGVYNFSNTTAEKITRKLCADFKIKIGSVVNTKAPIKKMIIDGSSIYDIIMMAYTKAARQTGKKYICRMEGEKLSVKIKGTKVKNFILEEGYNITDTQYEETIDNMVNTVKIYNKSGKQIGKINRDNWVKKYGIYQQTYRNEKGINAQTAAGSMLQGVEKKVTLDAINGNLDCIAGNGVEVYDKATGLNGLFWIDSDTHTWEDGIHIMSLDLNFKNIMDKKKQS